MKRITRGNSCFVSPPKIWVWGLYKWIIGLKDNVVYCFQRVKYGFCEADIWEMDSWFLKTIPAMLLHLKNSKLDYPVILEDPDCDMGFDISKKKKERLSAPEKWDAILTEMINRFDKLDAFIMHVEKKYSTHPFMGTEEEWKLREKYKEEAFELFSKWFFDLWW